MGNERKTKESPLSLTLSPLVPRGVRETEVPGLAWQCQDAFQKTAASWLQSFHFGANVIDEALEIYVSGPGFGGVDHWLVRAWLEPDRGCGAAARRRVAW